VRRRWNRGHERFDWICILKGPEPQVTPNGGSHDLRTARLEALALRREEVADALRSQSGELKTARRKRLREEAANPFAPRDQSRGSQSADVAPVVTIIP